MIVTYYESNYGFGSLDPIKDADLIQKVHYRCLVEELEDEMKHEYLRVNKLGAYK